MPPRSRVDLLPAQLRDELNARLVGNGFSGYQALSDWLAEQGYRVSKSALGVHGLELRQQFESAMDKAQTLYALAKARRLSGGDDSAAELVGAANDILAAHIVDTAAALDAESELGAEAKARVIATLTRAGADAGRTAIAQRKWEAQIRAEERAEAERQRSEALAAAADRVATAAEAKGLSAADARFWREQVLMGM